MAFIELTDNPSWVPDACTLPSSEQPLRGAEFDELFRSWVTGQERTSATTLRLTLKSEPDAAATAAALAARESQCCSFFTFVLTIASSDVHLTVEVQPEHVEVLAGLAQRAAAARQ